MFNAHSRAPRHRRVLWTLCFLLLCSIAACLLWLTLTYFPPLGSDTLQLTVPSLIGTSLSDWETVLPDAYYDLTVIPRHDTDAPVGTILGQLPSPGATRRVVPDQSRIPLRLTVSCGKRSLVLPNLIGTDVRETEIMLREAGLHVRVLEQTRTDLRAGQVIATDPTEGTELHEGELVTLTKSIAVTTRTVQVPDTVGMIEQYANTALVLRGLRPTKTQYAPSALPKDTVISQRPLGGTTVTVGTAVTVTLSDGSLQYDEGTEDAPDGNPIEFE